MKKTIKNYSEFINEGFISDLWKLVVNKYRKLKKKFGEHTWQVYLKNITEGDKLPKGVTVFIPDSITNEKVSMRHPDKEILNVEAIELIEELEDAYDFRIGTGKLSSVFLWGAPGIGKTDIVLEVAKKLGIEMIVFHLSQIDPTDFRGLPFVFEKTFMKDDGTVDKAKRSSSALPVVFPTSNGANGKGGILFLDEMNLAPDIVLKAAMPLALSGEYEGYKLPSKWIIISAGNRAIDIPDGDLTPITGALANRFKHLNFVATVEAWTEWAKKKEYVDPDLISFLNFGEDGKKWFHELAEEEQSSAWASPRSWTQASYEVYIKGNKSFNIPKDKKKRKYQGNVGFKATTAFFQYLDLIKIISKEQIENIYKTGSGPKPPQRLDSAHAVLNSIAFYKSGVKLTPDELKNLYKYAGDNIGDNFEKLTPFLSAFAKAHTDKNGVSYIKKEEPYKSISDKFKEKWYDMYQDIKKDSDGL